MFKSLRKIRSLYFYWICWHIFGRVCNNQLTPYLNSCNKTN